MTLDVKRQNSLIKTSHSRLKTTRPAKHRSTATVHDDWQGKADEASWQYWHPYSCISSRLHSAGINNSNCT